jgi:hypothetical protein
LLGCGRHPDGSIACRSRQWQAMFPGPVADFAAAGSVACAIDRAGALHCGRGDFADVRHDDGPLRTVRMGGDLACWLTVDGELGCAHTRNRAAVAPPAGRFTSLKVAGDVNCALDVGGDLHCWGRHPSVEEPLPSGPFRDYDVGEQGLCWIDAEGRASCRGVTARVSRQLDDLVRLDVFGRAALRGDGAVLDLETGERLATGRFVGIGRGCGLRDDGALACWRDVPRFVPPLD